MPVEIKTRGRHGKERLEALKIWASTASGLDGTLTLTRTKVLWRPNSIRVRIKEPKTVGGEGAVE